MPCCELASRKHTTQSSTCAKGSRATPTSRAYRDADPGLVCPTATTAAAVLLLEKLCCRCRTAAAVVVGWHLLREALSVGHSSSSPYHLGKIHYLGATTTSLALYAQQQKILEAECKKERQFKRSGTTFSNFSYEARL